MIIKYSNNMNLGSDYLLNLIAQLLNRKDQKERVYVCFQTKNLIKIKIL